jgi:putative phosphoesterase
MNQPDPGAPAIISIGVIADTHVPDRVSMLATGIFTTLARLKVDAIIHAGDITTVKVLQDLNTIAPVHAVCGNRDLLLLRQLPLYKQLEFNGVTIGISHGHGNLGHYLRDKMAYATVGYRFARYHDFLLATFPTAKILVFGHTHVPVCLWEGDRLFFNPGSACACRQNDYNPRLGVLRIHPTGRVEVEQHSIA